jgi:hypothetical protein
MFPARTYSCGDCLAMTRIVVCLVKAAVCPVLLVNERVPETSLDVRDKFFKEARSIVRVSVHRLVD